MSRQSPRKRPNFWASPLRWPRPIIPANRRESSIELTGDTVKYKMVLWGNDSKGRPLYTVEKTAKMCPVPITINKAYEAIKNDYYGAWPQVS